MSLWGWYQQHREDIAPLLVPLGSLAVGFGTIAVGGLVAWAALRQTRTATRLAEIANRQADIPRQRHEAQTKADLERRITETLSKAVEQLGGEKAADRLAGIYTLERLAHEDLGTPEQIAGPGLYLTMMEVLTQFVRENAKWPKEVTTPALPQSQTDPRAATAQSDLKPAIDVATVLDVIRRRPDAGSILENERGLRFNLRGTDLRGADLRWSNLESADLAGANLSNAELTGAKLRYANLQETDLSGANLGDDEGLKKAEAMATFEEGVGHLTFAYLIKENWAKALLGSPFRFSPADRRALVNHGNLRWTDVIADLSEASLVGADLREAKLGGACLCKADLRKADLRNATLTAANVRGADLRGAFLCDAKFAGAKLNMMELADANVTDARFEGADLAEVRLDGISLIAAWGDSKTRLLCGVIRPPHWHDPA